MCVAVANEIRAGALIDSIRIARNMSWLCQRERWQLNIISWREARKRHRRELLVVSEEFYHWRNGRGGRNALARNIGNSL